MVTVYGSDDNPRYTPCGILPDTNGCHPESVRSCWDQHAYGCGSLLDLCLSHRDNLSLDPLDFLVGPDYRAGLAPGQ
jgi:hypothetical protein